MLAFWAICVGFILVTFVMPFFALMGGRPSFDVSLQLAGALMVFFLASLVAAQVTHLVGAKRLTLVSLGLATGACFVLSSESFFEEGSPEEAIRTVGGGEAVRRLLEAALFYGLLVTYVIFLPFLVHTGRNIQQF